MLNSFIPALEVYPLLQAMSPTQVTLQLWENTSN